MSRVLDDCMTGDGYLVVALESDCPAKGSYGQGFVARRMITRYAFATMHGEDCFRVFETIASGVLADIHQKDPLAYLSPRTHRPSSAASTTLAASCMAGCCANDQLENTYSGNKAGQLLARVFSRPRCCSSLETVVPFTRLRRMLPRRPFFIPRRKTAAAAFRQTVSLSLSSTRL